jgi:hypothetical protein
VVDIASANLNGRLTAVARGLNILFKRKNSDLIGLHEHPSWLSAHPLLPVVPLQANGVPIAHHCTAKVLPIDGAPRSDAIVGPTDALALHRSTADHLSERRFCSVRIAGSAMPARLACAGHLWSIDGRKPDPCPIGTSKCVAIMHVADPTTEA